MGGAGLGDDAGLEGQGSDVADSALELLDQGVQVGGDDVAGQDRALIVAGQHVHSKGEGPDVQLLQQGGLGGSDALACGADPGILDDFDLGLVDLDA